MHFISVVRGGKHSSLRSHAYFSRADPAPPAQLLPRDVISDGVVGVTMVGSTTPAQKAAALKAYDVRISRLSQQLKWYRGNNDLYSNIRESDNWEADITTMRTRVVVERGGKQVDETEDERSNRSNQTEADELQRPNNHRSEAMAGRRHDDIEVDGIGAANDVKNCENLCGSNEMTVDNDDGSFLHSRIGHGCDELDRAMWRHNAPTPAHQNVRAEDEVCEQAANGLIRTSSA
ncbi:hypothetical protein PPTG_12945 [Phytophthora nicotianae INRA-310]|uniref:DUF6570 domain-containing protein n=1 Tax=Phytophthora nicotianae (strain INRA-310) TaxID=761204 RepID=W2Q199_PHYN3|nr:hypothetical protein PPTG_12945 [Phytophthora nicotianae INRA-310]ETN06973.1 hypothetical protein PPTG_12945 [Phytophthora nicotianae INRA-310]